MRYLFGQKNFLFCTLFQLNFVLGMTQEHVELVEVQKVNPRIEVELVYATAKNFTNQVIYPSTAKCLVRKEVAQALNAVQEALEKKGYCLKIWDAYRPMSAQQKFWDVLASRYPDEKEREKYVSNPMNGGRHTRGVTFDCTLVDKNTKQEVEKPTDFDHFGPEAWSNYQGPKLSQKAKEHRELLASIMKDHGFDVLDTEWWHFDFKKWKDYPPLNVEFQ